MTDLLRLRGIGPNTAKALREEGYETAEEVLEEDDEELLKVPGIGRGILMKLEISEERDLKGFRVPGEWREMIKEAIEGTEYTLTDAIDVLLPDDLEKARMEIPEEEFVSMYVEADVHEKVTYIAGENVTALDVLEKYVGDLSSEDLKAQLDNQSNAEDNEENDD